MSNDSLIALVLRDNRVEWTALQRRKGRMEVASQKALDITWPEGVVDPDSPEAIAHLKGLLPAAKGRLGLAIPADRVLMRIAELPSTDLEELEGMAELQLDKISPFPSDQMALAVEVLRRDEEHESSRVLIAAVRHSYIDRLGEKLLQAGLYPQSVDVDVLGWWSLISESGRVSEEGDEAVMIHDDHCAQLLILRDGLPVIIRSLDPGIDPADESTAGDLAAEIEYTLMTIEGTWGAAEIRRLTCWMHGEVPEHVLAALREACGIEVDGANLDSLPPLSEGISRRLAGREPRLDLAPHTWKQTIQSRKYQRRAVAVAASAFAVWAVLIGGLWFWSNQQKNMLAETQNEIVRLQNEVKKVRELEDQVKSLEEYADRTYSGLECLREVSSMLPAAVDITSFTYNKESQVALRGEADSDRPINDFIANLENSPLFTSVRTEAITTQNRKGRNRSLFRVTMNLPVQEEEPES